MRDREIVNYLLCKESEISNRIHGAIMEILRLGYDSDRGKKQAQNMIESIQYIFEDIERVVNR